MISDITSDKLYFTITWNGQKENRFAYRFFTSGCCKCLALLQLCGTLRENWKIKGNTKIYSLPFKSKFNSQYFFPELDSLNVNLTPEICLYYKTLTVVNSRSSLIYNTSARHEWHECDTDATRVRHECNTSATRTTQVRQECYTNVTNETRVKNFDFDTDTSKNIFTSLYLLYSKWKTTRGRTISF